MPPGLQILSLLILIPAPEAFRAYLCISVLNTARTGSVPGFHTESACLTIPQIWAHTDKPTIPMRFCVYSEYTIRRQLLILSISSWVEFTNSTEQQTNFNPEKLKESRLNMPLTIRISPFAKLFKSFLLDLGNSQLTDVVKGLSSIQSNFSS